MAYFKGEWMIEEATLKSHPNEEYQRAITNALKNIYKNS
jgi:hypothetical protein